MLTCECQSMPSPPCPRPAGIELLTYLHCSAKWFMEALELWVKELLKSRVQTGKGSPSTHIACNPWVGWIPLYMQPRHIPIFLLTLAFKEFICKILVLENRDFYPVVITFHYLLAIWTEFCQGASPVIQSPAPSYFYKLPSRCPRLISHRKGHKLAVFPHHTDNTWQDTSIQRNQSRHPLSSGLLSRRNPPAHKTQPE